MPRYLLQSYSRTVDLGHRRLGGPHEGEGALLGTRRADGPGYRTRMPPGWPMSLVDFPARLKAKRP